MNNFYNNVPKTSSTDNSFQKTINVFENYTQAPITVNASTLDAMIAFFSSRGFLEDAAESTALIIIRQANKDKINPFDLLDTLKGLNDVQLSDLVTELLNYNRYKSSSLGYASPFTTNDEIARNIVA
jgi:hypothetical protein